MVPADEPVTELEAVLLERSGDALVGVDPAGRVVLWNGRAAARFGLDAQAALGRPWPAAAGSGPAPEPTHVRQYGDRTLYIYAAAAPEAPEEAAPDLARIFDAIPLGLVLWDRGNRIVYANREARVFAGLDPAGPWRSADSELLRWHLHDLEGRSLGKARPILTHVLSTGQAVADRHYLSIHDGRSRRLRLAGVPLTGASGFIDGVVIIAEDRTDSFEADLARRESQERFELLEQNCRDAVWFATPDMTRCLYVSPAIETLTALAPDVFRERWIELGDLIHVEDRDRLFSLTGDRAAPLEIEYRIVRADGGVRWVRDRRHPICDESGRAYMIIGISTDITEQKEWQGQLLQAQKMEAAGVLAAGIAHDFNNLLTIINGYSKIALRDLDGHDPNLVRLRQILAAGERAAGLTRQLLAFGRKQVLEPRVFDWNVLVRDAAPLLTHLLGEHRRLVLELHPEPLPVAADSGQLHHALMNLAINARDAMPDGGVLTLSTGADGAEAWLTVRDTGVGMDEATRLRAVEPFFTTKPPGQGSGLGLSSVYGIVRQSRGDLSIESSPGAGTLVRLRLPRLAALPAPPPAATPGTSPGGGRVLLVDDEATVRAAVADGLRQLGYSVEEAGGAEEALRLLDGARPVDLLLTDVRMPGTSGAALADAIRRRFAALPVLFMSGQTDLDLKTHFEHPRTAFIPKPFTADQLAARIEALLDGG